MQTYGAAAASAWLWIAVSEAACMHSMLQSLSGLMPWQTYGAAAAAASGGWRRVAPNNMLLALWLVVACAASVVVAWWMLVCVSC
jgi:hypothetical protein